MTVYRPRMSVGLALQYSANTSKYRLSLNTPKSEIDIEWTGLSICL